MNNLTEQEITKIEQFCTDETMFNAVRKVLLAGIYTHGTVQKDFIPDPLMNGAFSLVSLAPTNPIPDEIIGQQLRAQWAGINALKNSYDSLKSIKSTPKEGIISQYNEAV